MYGSNLEKNIKDSHFELSYFMSREKDWTLLIQCICLDKETALQNALR